MRTALIENGTVTNIAIGGHGIPCPDNVGIGYAYDEQTGEFSPPPAPVIDPKAATKAEIAKLEPKADTYRLRRELASGNPGKIAAAQAIIADIDAQIAALRAQL